MQDEVEEFWTSVFRQRFPAVILRRNHRIPEEEEVPFYNVFMIPDDQHREYIEFCLEELWKVEESTGRCSPFFLPVGVEDTKKFYPDVYREAQGRRGLSVGKKAQKRTPRKPAKTAARATARHVN